MQGIKLGYMKEYLRSMIFIIFFTYLCAVCSAAQSCPTLCSPMNCSLPGFTVYGIFQSYFYRDVSFKIFIYSFIRLLQVLVAAHGIFPVSHGIFVLQYSDSLVAVPRFK